MPLIDLKERIDIESLLQEINLLPELAESIRNEIRYFDEYYLTSNVGLIKVFRQEFRKDPYMRLNSIPLFRLITYSDDVAVGDLEEIFNKDNMPIITRAKGTMTKQLRALGFDHIKNGYGSHETKLLSIRFPIPKPTHQLKINKNIRRMSKEDLVEIEELFKNEYSLKYKMVRMMYYDCPEVCFVYEEAGRIRGVAFNKVVEDELYMRQIFVEEKFRGKEIGRLLYERRLDFARMHNLTAARGNIRMEARLFHELYNPIREEKNPEYYVIRS